jgi:hypothetical protein
MLGLIPPDHAAAALGDSSPESARRLLDALYDHHLISEPAPGRYLLHDLLREHARSLAAADEEDSRKASGRLVNYYAHTAAAASRHIATWTTLGGRQPPGRPPVSAPQMVSSQQASGWLESERANLQAAANHAAADGLPRHAIAIVTAIGGFLRARGYWDQAADLYRTARTAAHEDGDQLGEAGALDEPGLLQQLTGDYTGATANLARRASEPVLGAVHQGGDRRGQRIRQRDHDH